MRQAIRTGIPLTVTLDNAKGGTVERVRGHVALHPGTQSTAPAPSRCTLGRRSGIRGADGSPGDVTSARSRSTRDEGARKRRGSHADVAALRRDAVDARAPGAEVELRRRHAHDTRLEGSHRFRAGAPSASRRRRAGSRAPARCSSAGRRPDRRRPDVADGVMEVRVRTRTAGKLPLRVDSRSQTLTVPASSKVQTLRIQVTTRPARRGSPCA